MRSMGLHYMASTNKRVIDLRKPLVQAIIICLTCKLNEQYTLGAGTKHRLKSVLAKKVWRPKYAHHTTLHKQPLICLAQKSKVCNECQNHSNFVFLRENTCTRSHNAYDAWFSARFAHNAYFRPHQLSSESDILYLHHHQNVTKSNGKNKTFEKKTHGKEVSHDNHSWAGRWGGPLHFLHRLSCYVACESLF